MSRVAFHLSGTPIPWTVYGMLKRRYEPDALAYVLWKAKDWPKDKGGPLRFLMAAYHKKFDASDMFGDEWQSRKEHIRQWADSLVSPKPAATKAGDAMKALFRQLAEGA